MKSTEKWLRYFGLLDVESATFSILQPAFKSMIEAIQQDAFAEGKKEVRKEIDFQASQRERGFRQGLERAAKMCQDEGWGAEVWNKLCALIEAGGEGEE